MKTKALDVSTGNIVEIEDPDEVVNDEENLVSLRARRNEMLASTDWVITMHKELGTNIPAAWKTYRQELRDITDSAKSLNDVTWPEKPE